MVPAVNAASLRLSSLLFFVFAEPLTASLDPLYVKEKGLSPPPPARPSRWPSPIDDCCTCTDATPSAASGCLYHCGFAVVADAYDPQLLQETAVAFDAWQAAHTSDALSFKRNDDSTTNIQSPRRRVEFGVPDADPFNRRDWRLNRLIVQAVSEYLEAAGEPSAAPTLESMTLIHSLPGSELQKWHRDSPYVDGVKVQVPLRDVVEELGPVELQPIRNSDACQVVRAVSKQGTAIMYLSKLSHRGSQNKAAVARTVVDFNYMLPESALQYDYLDDFPAHVLAAMQRHNEGFVDECAAAGLDCQPLLVPLDQIKRLPPPSPPTTSMALATSFKSWQSVCTGVVVFVALAYATVTGKI